MKLEIKLDASELLHILEANTPELSYIDCRDILRVARHLITYVEKRSKYNELRTKLFARIEKEESKFK